MEQFSLIDIVGMRRISVRELGRRTGDVFDDLTTEGRALITRNGRPLAVLSPITDPRLQRRKALEPIPESEWQALAGLSKQAGRTPDPKQPDEVPLPDVELDKVRRRILAEIAWFGGRPWVANDDDVERISMKDLSVALGSLEIGALVTRRGRGLVLTRLGARFVAERLGAEYVAAVGSVCYYGYPPSRLGYGPPNTEEPAVAGATPGSR